MSFVGAEPQGDGGAGGAEQPSAITPDPGEAETRNTSPRRRSSWRYTCQSAAGMVLTFAIIGSGMVFMPPEIDLDFSSFMEADVPSFIEQRGLHAARLHKKEQNGRRLESERWLVSQFELRFYYDAAPGAILTVDNLRAIAAFELKLRALPGWRALCAEGRVRKVYTCDPGASLLGYVFPTRVTWSNDSNIIVPDALKLDGAARRPLPLDVAVRLSEGMRDTFFPTGEEPTSTSQLRSQFSFRMKCCKDGSPASMIAAWQENVDKEWDAFLETEILPAVREAKLLDGAIEVHCDGSSMISPVLETLMNDLHWAGGSMAFVLLYLAFHTNSAMLSILGLITVFLAVPLAYVFFSLMSGSSKMSIASFVSVFLIFGLGTDVVFVYNDFWRESVMHHDNEVDRLSWTYRKAGKASFATTVATALSFLANLASVIRPLREFGLFMGLCVAFVYFLVPLIFAPLCVLEERRRNEGCWRRRRRTFRRRSTDRAVVACGGQGDSAEQPRFAGLRSRLLGQFAVHLHRFRWLYFLLPAITLASSVVVALVSTETTTSAPKLFPEDHIETRKAALVLAFTSVPDVKSQINYVGVCAADSFDRKAENCPIFWCEAVRSEDSDSRNSDSCHCYRQETICRSVVRTRYVGLEAEALGAGKALNPIMFQEWLTGFEVLWPFVEVLADPQNSSCGWYEICFCNTGGLACKLGDAWRYTGTVAPNARRRLVGEALSPLALPSGELGFAVREHCDEEAEKMAATDAAGLVGGGHSPRRLSWRPFAPAVVSMRKQASVDVAVGVRVRTGSKLIGQLDPSKAWSYHEDFFMEHPWTQRFVRSLCTDLPVELRVVYQTCWIEDFRKWTEDQKHRFPLYPAVFETLAFQWATTGFVSAGRGSNILQGAGNRVWLEGGKLKASSLNYIVDVSVDSHADAVVTYRKMWDDFLRAANGPAFLGLPPMAFHTSNLWVRADVANALVLSTINTMAIIVVLAFLCMILFTGSILLSFYVVMETVLVICGLTFFIVVIMDLKIGPLEVIALIFFLGYSVTYSLHVAHHYGDRVLTGEEMPEGLPERQARRLQRASFALRSIGGAALGSAATTVGCAFFLLFCTLYIFKVLGGVAIAVTLLSILTALVNLPAALLSCGPVDPGCSNCGSSVSSRSSDAAPELPAESDEPPALPPRINVPGRDSVGPTEGVNCTIHM